MSVTRITISRPDDRHVHFDDGAMLKTVLSFTAKLFGRTTLSEARVTTVARA